MTHPIDFVTKLPKGELVSSCWRNSVSKMVIKSVAIQTRRKVVKMLKEFYFSKEPHLQARPNKLDMQEFPRASFAVSSELCPNAYVFLSDDLY
jgi:hypothetical protein